MTFWLFCKCLNWRMIKMLLSLYIRFDHGKKNLQLLVEKRVTLSACERLTHTNKPLWNQTASFESFTNYESLLIHKRFCCIFSLLFLIFFLQLLYLFNTHQRNKLDALTRFCTLRNFLYVRSAILWRKKNMNVVNTIDWSID